MEAAGRHKALSYLTTLPPVQTAYITTHVLLNEISKQRIWSTVALQLGRSLESEARIRKVSKVADVRGYMDRHKYDAFHLYRRGFQGLERANGVVWDDWSTKECIRAGLVLLEIAVEQGCIQRSTIKENRRVKNYVSATDSTLSWLEEAHHHYADLALAYEPCPVVPNWDPPSPHEAAVPAARRLQEVPWVRSETMCDLFLLAFEGRSALLPQLLDLPSKPAVMQGEAKEIWKTQAHDTHIRNVALRAKRVRSAALAAFCRSPGCEGSLYFPTTVDFRGRVYYGGSIHPAADSAAKSLFLFDSAGPIDHAEVRRWQAECYGGPVPQDVAERVQADPLGTRSCWEGAKDPWLFLQACVHADHPGLPVSVDASNHGLQIISLLTRTGLDDTNVTSDHKRDLYTDIGRQVLPGHSDIRALVKPIVMNLPYGMKRRSVQKHFVVELGVSWKYAEKLAIRFEEAMPKWAMKFLEDVRSDPPLSWLSPSGFKVINNYVKYEGLKVNTYLFGKQRVGRWRLPTNKRDMQATRRATAANIVHSMDAAILHNAVTPWDRPIGTAHDRFITTSEHLPELRKHLRKTVQETFREPVDLPGLPDTILTDPVGPHMYT